MWIGWCDEVPAVIDDDDDDDGGGGGGVTKNIEAIKVHNKQHTIISYPPPPPHYTPPLPNDKNNHCHHAGIILAHGDKIFLVSPTGKCSVV